jgi:hypothetical protein
VKKKEIGVDLYNEISLLLSISNSTIASLLVHTEDLDNGITLSQHHLSNMLWQVEINLETVREHVNLLAQENYALKRAARVQVEGSANLPQQ